MLTLDKMDMSICYRLFFFVLQISIAHSQFNTGCGGEYSDRSGVIKSPNFPSAYPDNSRCSWKITADANGVIALRFEHVDLAVGSNCPDSVTVYDGDTDLSPVIVRFCEYKTPEELSSTIIRSRGNQLLLNFSSDYVNHNSGFDAIYWSVVCEPFKYGNESCDKPCNCVQTNTRFCHSVNGTCVCKTGWKSADCSADVNECTQSRVELCPDYQQCSNTIGSYSCDCKPGMVKNSTRHCEVDKTLGCTKSNCSHVCAKVPSTTQTSSFSEQCYCPHNMMLNGTRCAVCPLLSYGDNCRFQCNCVANNTERCDPDTGGCICKPGWRSSDCSLDINECELANAVCEPTKFCVNSIGSFRCEDCHYVLNGSKGVITSLNYPNPAPPSSDCTWLISVSNPNVTITLRFPVIEQYYSSILTIYDGVNLESPLIGSYHGLDDNVKIRSTGNSLFILAFNGPWPYGQGFNGTYEINETPGCLYQARSASGILKLEAGKYKASSDFFFCFWDLYAPAYQVITVKLSDIGDLTDCSQAYVKVYNVTFYRGYIGYAKYCGSNIPQFLRSYENTMSIEYFVNKTGPQPRLNGSYVVTDCNWKYGDACEHDCRCNRTYTQFCNNLNGNCECVSGMTGADCSVDIDECKINTTCHPALTCRNTFGSYECELEKTEPVGQFDCYYSHWGKTYQVSIKAPANQVVTLSVSDFGAFVRQNCDLDFSVFNGNSSNSQLGYYCGSKVPKLLRTTQNVMRLTTLNNYGLTACHAEYQTHSCPPFTYSAECKVSCKCLKETSVSCDSVYGTCVCKPGYTGRDCSQDIDECTFVKNCTQNSECINTPGSYICQCLRGYTHNTVTGLCEISQECLELDGKRCSHTCYLVDGKPMCGCPEYLVLDDIVNLNCVTPFYMYSGVANSFGPSETEKKIDFNTKLPFGTKTVSSAFINKSGVIYFDNSASMNPSIDYAHSSAVKLIAPLWAKYNPKNGSVSYQLIENCRLTDFTIPTKSFAQTEILKRAAKDVKTFRPEIYDFEVNTVLIVTWQKLQLPKRSEELTFQAIYISGYEKKVLYGEEVSDGTESSYVMFIYQKGKDKWGAGHPASIGFTNGDASIDIVKLFPGILMNLGYYNTDSKLPPGVMMFSVGNVNSHEQKCKQYLCKHVHLKSSPTYLSQINELHKCPCSLDRLALQWDLYERRDNYDCYALSQRTKVRFFSTNPRNKLCCYTRPAFNYSIAEMRSSTYLQNFPEGGHVLLSDPWIVSPNRKEALKNIEAHSSCCKSPVMCDKFFVIFPDMKCSLNVTFFTTNDYGDPHLTTLDGVSYSMNAWGEFILLQSSEHKFMLQGRTSRVQSKNQLLNATVFTAFAAQQSNESRFQVELALTNTTLNVFVDGLDVTKDFYKNEYYNLSTDFITVSRGFKYNKTTVKAIFSCGVGLEVQIGNKSLDIMVQADITLKNKTRGLMGNFNDNMDDDFQMANGTIIPRNSTERKIFMYFVKNYEVNSSTSIFTYEAGERNINYQHPEFVPMFLDEQNPLTLTAAKAFCGALNTPCIYDYIATGDANFAKSTNFTKNEYDALKSSLVNKLPIIKSLNSTTYNNTLWLVTKGKANTLQIVAADDDGDALTFIIDGKPANLSVSATGLITYTPWSIPSSSFVIKVKDAKGGYSSSLLVLLAYCSACNNHGNCSLNSSTVINGVEKLKCHCQPAYTGEDCESELDACSLSPCQPGRTCQDLSAAQQGNNTVGYTCGPCPAGFSIGDDDICLDTDECKSVGVCSQVCSNTYGSFECSCRNGYRLDQINKKSCIDINECEEKTALCQQGCQNTNGNYTCTCFDGYTLHSDGLHCVLNISRQSACQICQQFCTVIEDTMTCGCHNGYRQDPSDFTKCIDINECSERNMPCSQVCTNTVGHYECSCYSGYRLNNDSTTCTACKSPYYGNNCNSTCECGLNGLCDLIRGCICQDGWTGEKCTVDVNECSNVTACPAGQICSNIYGRYQCNCPDGYAKINGTCKDIDECSDLQLGSFCSSELNEICVNTIGSYQCQCRTGFYRNKLSVCLDIDECSSGVDGCEQICENTVGSFNCKCYPGYWKSFDRKHCVDVKEICKDHNITCSHNCTLDTNGQPYCVCPRGYQLINSNTCQDINECTNSSLNLCSYKERCVNTEGGFTCTCPLGQTLDNNERTCLDCDGNTWGLQCANQCACGLGSLKCDTATGCFCKPGFTGRYCNEDVDECATGQQKCSINEVCVNTPGSAECQCQSGFNRKNGVCTDINECQDKYLHNCKQSCTNTVGSFSCNCYPGYGLNTTTNICIDINECQQGTHLCSGACINTEGSYSCSCSSGLILQEDGLTCAEPYSCGSYKCSEHLKCSKIGNNHICMCHNGRLPDLNGHCIDCNRVLTDKNGTFMSTNYPSNYPDNSDCTWTITTNITNAFITLSFQSYDVEGCPYDYIEVYDGNSTKSKLIGRYCDTIPNTILSTGNALHVVFTSDTSENQKGFLASYVSAVSCRLKKCSHNCQITATNPWTETCTCPDWMKLDSTGTECKLINACNTTINASSGYIVSPNYPSNYPDNSSCYWTIAGSNSSKVNMSFSEFSLEGGEGCPYDYISIFDGFNKSAPLLGRYCSDIIPSTTLSTKNAMHLILKSDGSANSKGFKMFYTIQ